MVDIDSLIGKVRGLKKGKEFQKAEPLAEFRLTYDALAETLEPVYFWILDIMRGTGGSGFGMEVEKLVDNFIASPGSGYFADIGARATRMQEQGMKILATINTVMRSVLNLIYDLKEFEIRLEHYNKYRGKNEREKEGGLLALKQIWMDRVDIRRGAGSINMLTQQLDFVTLRDAFMKAKKPEEVDKMDLNERVKRLLKPRMGEFLDWLGRSERELRNRHELQKTYLKSQVSAVKLYTRWVKPYLKAAEELMMRKELGAAGPSPSSADIITSFNTIVLELQILAKSKIDLEGVRKAIGAGIFPEKLWNIKMRQDYYSCVFADFTFRGLPRIASRAESSHYVHSGRARVVLKAYVLNGDEYNLLKKEIENQDLYEGLRLIEGITTDSLEPIYEDLLKYMEGEKKEEKDTRSFLEKLLGSKPKEKEKVLKLRKETFVERQIRALISNPDAIRRAWLTYHLYKKAHGMPTPLWEFESVPGE